MTRFTSSRRLPFKHPATLISTWFGVGYFPFAPGTLASLVAVPLAWLIATQFGSGSVYIAAFAAFLIGLYPAHYYAKNLGTDDPKEVVIDEIAGQWLALAFASPDILWHYAAGFLLFRLFDIFKPWPVNWGERLPGGWGIMIDDLIAAIYASVLIYAGIWITDQLHVQAILEQSG